MDFFAGLIERARQVPVRWAQVEPSLEVDEEVESAARGAAPAPMVAPAAPRAERPRPTLASAPRREPPTPPPAESRREPDRPAPRAEPPAVAPSPAAAAPLTPAPPSEPERPRRLAASPLARVAVDAGEAAPGELAPAPEPPQPGPRRRAVAAPPRLQERIEPETADVGPVVAALPVAAAAEEVVRISIGRIEVRATAPAVTTFAPAPALARPKLSLDDYLAGRDGGRR